MKKGKSGVMELPIKAESDVFEASAAALQLADETGFARLECNLIATAVSEITMNVVRYGDKGVVRIARTANKKGLSIEVNDKGPGIADTERAMKDGYTTSTASLGVGMGAARRAMDVFSVRSRPGFGTKVKMEKYLPLPTGAIEYGVVSLPDDHYEVNGDGYLIREFGGDKVLLAIIDGLGQGRNAYKSALLVQEVISTHHYLPLDNILYKCEAALKAKGGDFGAAIGLMLVKPRSFHYAAIGDTFLKILGGRESQLPSQRGIVGPFPMPHIRVQKKSYSRKNMVVALCTDGIKAHFSARDLPSGADVHSLAQYIMENYRREFGDATVMVIRFNKTK